MTDQDRSERRSGWLKTDAMARLCGVSDATVKRRAADGKPIKCPDGTLVTIESERIERPQGWEWRVRAVTAPPALTERSAKTDQETPPATVSDAQSDQRAMDILETILRANGATFERQEEDIRRLTREVWQKDGDARVARAELSAAQTALSAALKRSEELTDQLAAQATEVEAVRGEVRKVPGWLRKLFGVKDG